MCIGCRERHFQDELVRLQASPESVVIVEMDKQRRPGRSVYLCPKIGCMEKVIRRGEIVIKGSKYDKIIVRLEQRQAERLRYAFSFAARRLRASLGVGPED
ncbi:DUF448 domain-containing protein [bacterium]|nr:DUF448 domain-containing protein [bacterium]